MDQPEDARPKEVAEKKKEQALQQLAAGRRRPDEWQ
jgi:hypothetical protein